MPIYTRFSAIVIILLSISITASANSFIIANSRTVPSEEIERCQLDEKAVEQLHEIRTERKHTRLMLQNIEGVNNQLINNDRRRLQNRLIRIERAEQFVLATSCNESIP